MYQQQNIPLSKGAVIILLVLVLISSTFAMWARPTAVPLNRLLQNVDNYIAKNPKDAQGYYVRGRLHSLAYAKGTRDLEMYDVSTNKLPNFPSYESIMTNREGKFQWSKAAKDHLEASIRDFQKATELDPRNAMSFLGLGWVLEDGAQFAKLTKAFPKERKPQGATAFWQEHALVAYRKAYQLTINADLKSEHFGPGANAAISREAGERILALLRNRKVSEAESLEIAQIEKNIEEIEKKPRAITPIIFPLDAPTPLSNLLATDQRVRFDLAGDGKPTIWPWVKPNVGILVWDPKHSGRIVSGQQLFGSVTWWISWENGYQPLAMLDNDGDGWLAGKEMNGLAVWVDVNANGISDPGEVKPVLAYSIMRIAVRNAADNFSAPTNERGIQLHDGRFLPTYDWTPTEIRPNH